MRPGNDWLSTPTCPCPKLDKSTTVPLTLIFRGLGKFSLHGVYPCAKLRTHSMKKRISARFYTHFVRFVTRHRTLGLMTQILGLID